MKIAVAALLAALLATTAASAQKAAKPVWVPNFIKVNKPADYLAAFPPRALAEKLSGSAKLECVAAADGRLVDCKVGSEDPAGYGFGEAALKLVANERISKRDHEGKSVAGRPVTTDLNFLVEGDSNADWLKKPDVDEMAMVYPTEAIKQGLDGRAIIECGLTVEGFLSNCKVFEENPAGIGFGAAALQLAPQFRMKPMMRRGKAVAMPTIKIPVTWLGMDVYKEGPPSDGRRVILDPPWTAVPAAQDVRLAWPAKATEKVATAAVNCRLTKEGGLKSCSVISETPTGRGFGRAALALAKIFKVRLTPDEVEKADDYWVDIPFRFRNPSEDDTRRVTSPKWIRTLSAAGGAQIFPDLAKVAGVTNGLGVINCEVGAGGVLQDCKTVREDPVGMGFGEAALKAAAYVVMNPWSVDGDPLDGLRVTVPIRLRMDAPSDPPEPAPAP